MKSALLHRVPRLVGYAFLAALSLACGAETPVPGADPKINAYYRDADVMRWKHIFESAGREVFDKRFAIVNALGLIPGMQVADIGAGTGLFTMLLARSVGPGGKVYAVDIAPNFVDGINERARRYHVDNIETLLNDQHSTKLPPDSIDLAFICDTYHHFEHPQSMLSSIHAALRPGGALVIVDFHRNPGFSKAWIMQHVRADRDTVIEEVERAGFRLTEQRELLRENFYLRFERGAEPAQAPAEAD